MLHLYVWVWGGACQWARISSSLPPAPPPAGGSLVPYLLDETHPCPLPLPPAPPPAGGSLVPYLLDEKKGWALSLEELRLSVKEAREEGKLVRGLVFINPGNPTGRGGV